MRHPILNYDCSVHIVHIVHKVAHGVPAVLPPESLREKNLLNF